MPDLKNTTIPSGLLVVGEITEINTENAKGYVSVQVSYLGGSERFSYRVTDDNYIALKNAGLGATVCVVCGAPRLGVKDGRPYSIPRSNRILVFDNKEG